MKITVTLPDGSKAIMEATDLKIESDIKEFRIKPENQNTCISITEISGRDIELKPINTNKIKLK